MDLNCVYFYKENTTLYCSANRKFLTHTGTARTFYFYFNGQWVTFAEKKVDATLESGAVFFLNP